jgi:NTE family protein
MAEQGEGRRALVLGGGGVAGVAWETGLLAGLLERGIDVSDADVVVGTSAGSVVGAVLRAGALQPTYESLLEPPSYQLADIEGLDLEPLLAAGAAAAQSSGTEEQARTIIGRVAARAHTPETDDQAVARFEHLLPTAEWPSGELRVTAVDALDGTFRVLDSRSGVPLARAIAASCAVPGVYPATLIDGRLLMDGGMRSSTNADVAADCDRVLIVACGPELPESSLGPTLTRAADALSATAEVLVIVADADSTAAFGTNALLPESSTASALAGFAQAATVAERVREFWR